MLFSRVNNKNNYNFFLHHFHNFLNIRILLFRVLQVYKLQFLLQATHRFHLMFPINGTFFSIFNLSKL